ncbi:WGR domain-containing protein [Erythrobacter sp. W302b]|uniref:WGR domain-containing protein n=1 Tax=Erythrobacter sp. W302b TaxID=3389874 RepID=UPI00396AF409
MERPYDQSWHWQAIDPSRNIARNYQLWVATDLFGWTTVERRWGRIGTKGKGATASFENRGDAEMAARRIRLRRRSSLRRIGIGYHELD